MACICISLITCLGVSPNMITIQMGALQSQCDTAAGRAVLGQEPINPTEDGVVLVPWVRSQGQVSWCSVLHRLMIHQPQQLSWSAFKKSNSLSSDHKVKKEFTSIAFLSRVYSFAKNSNLSDFQLLLRGRDSDL